MAMTDVERQRKRRAKLNDEAKKFIAVRGSDGEFDERLRVALSVRELVLTNQLPDEIIKLIVKTSENVFPTKDRLTKRYINKLVLNYLTME
tara:strand:- start:40594 stop:40866 length:273 start_codon:yes stop_codon:yes gene_type:complete